MSYNSLNDAELNSVYNALRAGRTSVIETLSEAEYGTKQYLKARVVFKEHNYSMWCCFLEKDKRALKRLQASTWATPEDLDRRRSDIKASRSQARSALYELKEAQAELAAFHSQN